MKSRAPVTEKIRLGYSTPPLGLNGWDFSLRVSNPQRGWKQDISVWVCILAITSVKWDSQTLADEKLHL